MIQRFFVRADGGVETGAGHVMRCLALAEALKLDGRDATFLIRDTEGRLSEAIGRRGFGVERIPSCLDWKSELSLVLRRLGEAGDSAGLVLDGYHFGVPYQRAIKAEGFFLVRIVDSPDAHHWADVVIDQNLQPDSVAYAVQPYTRLLLGPRYALLRQEFVRRAGERRAVGPDVARVLITMGGSDPGNQTLTAMQAIEVLQVDDLETKVIIGTANPHGATLRAFADRARHRFELVVDPGDMAELMCWADLAVSAAGSTSWEMMCVGLPSIKIVLSDNQAPLAREMARGGLCWSLGWQGDVSAEDLGAAIRELSRDVAARREMSRRGGELVDGLGACRVAAEIVS